MWQSFLLIGSGSGVFFKESRNPMAADGRLFGYPWIWGGTGNQKIHPQETGKPIGKK
jgi:hypothetical protein